MAKPNAMLDAWQESDSYCRIEVITGKRRRCQWTAEEKSRIVAQSFEARREHPNIRRPSLMFYLGGTVGSGTLRPR